MEPSSSALGLFTTPEYQQAAIDVLIAEANRVAKLLDLKEPLPITRTNLIEAQKCAHAALDFIRTYPERSLGIVALNRPQADLIEVELDRLISQDPHAIAYRARWEDSIEPLFVKNLESVQGDERDVIFISVGFYGS